MRFPVSDVVPDRFTPLEPDSIRFVFFMLSLSSSSPERFEDTLSISFVLCKR